MLIIGAGGFAKELLEMIILSKRKEKIFLFDDIDLNNKCIGDCSEKKINVLTIRALICFVNH